MRLCYVAGRIFWVNRPEAVALVSYPNHNRVWLNQISKVLTPDFAYRFWTLSLRRLDLIFLNVQENNNT